MRLSHFILQNLDEILRGWEAFARTIGPARLMSIAELRDDAERMLRFVAADIEIPQSRDEQFDKSVGRQDDQAGPETAAHDHGVARAVAHFSLSDLVSEYRALRASVTRLWLERSTPTVEDALQLVRFNEAVDQLIAESVLRFADRLEADSNLVTASIGHDLRNPLNAVVMWAHVLEKSKGLDDKERSAVLKIREAALRLVGMVGELQDFTRTRLGSPLVYSREPCDVGTICRAVVDELAIVYPDAPIRLIVTGDLLASCDRGRIAQTVSNLVGNAVQHGAAGQPVTVRASGESDAVRVTVHNMGHAIPERELDEIFEPLKRGGADEVRDAGEHLGLGLYIARRIATAHGGSVTVASSAAEGTTFELVLPRKAAANAID